MGIQFHPLVENSNYEHTLFIESVEDKVGADAQSYEPGPAITDWGTELRSVSQPTNSFAELLNVSIALLGAPA